MIQKGNGAELRGNAIENKGNTTDKSPVSATMKHFSFNFSVKRATPEDVKRATHAMWRFPR